jgi:methyl-accepting chemotaxis protein
VLAKEINSLSGQTGLVAADAKTLQLTINKKVAGLLEKSNENTDSIDPGEVDVISQDIGGACRRVEQMIAQVSAGIRKTGSHIDEVRSSLSFLENLQDRLIKIAALVEDAKGLLEPWKDLASMDSGEMNQLIERYTMELERAVHSFDRGEGEQQEQSDEDVFFFTTTQ